MKRIFFIISIFLILLSGISRAERDELFFKVGAGAGASLLNNLSDELETQGNELPFPEYSISVSMGKTFSNNTIRAEAVFGFSLLQDVRYQNEYENFTETMSHYDFALMVRRVFAPERKILSPSLGVGIGYGRTNLIEGAGRIDSFELLGSLQVDSEVRDNMDIFVELFYVQGVSEKKFGSPFLENLDSDVLLDSSGNPLKDRYGVAGLRIGITVWLRALEQRY
ncbi:MAG: hypothetical protein GF417_12870 [Candidatus Latescibacteria bacterium]|nr:hypothetical protein [bacterium]MBD3425321.1 hypothetical protein [Candidatus Latescibacterota bacterium]